jgi:hypothetical protein
MSSEPSNTPQNLPERDRNIFKGGEREEREKHWRERGKISRELDFRFEASHCYSRSICSRDK